MRLAAGLSVFRLVAEQRLFVVQPQVAAAKLPVMKDLPLINWKPFPSYPCVRVLHPGPSLFYFKTTLLDSQGGLNAEGFRSCLFGLVKRNPLWKVFVWPCRLPLSLCGFLLLKCGFHAFSVQLCSRVGEWIAVLFVVDGWAEFCSHKTDIHRTCWQHCDTKPTFTECADSTVTQNWHSQNVLTALWHKTDIHRTCWQHCNAKLTFTECADSTVMQNWYSQNVLTALWYKTDIHRMCWQHCMTFTERGDSAWCNAVCYVFEEYRVLIALPDSGGASLRYFVWNFFWAVYKLPCIHS